MILILFFPSSLNTQRSHDLEKTKLTLWQIEDAQVCVCVCACTCLSLFRSAWCREREKKRFCGSIQLFFIVKAEMSNILFRKMRVCKQLSPVAEIFIFAIIRDIYRVPDTIIEKGLKALKQMQYQ